MRILFVCLGNICRSPTAEAVMAGLVRDAGLDRSIEVESAGTGSWHVGEPPDPRSLAEAARRGIELTGVARRVSAADFEQFDLLVAMDRQNERDLHALAPDDRARRKVSLLRIWDDRAVASGAHDVPDPYYGGADGFADVVDVIEPACAALLAELRARL